MGRWIATVVMCSLTVSFVATKASYGQPAGALVVGCGDIIDHGRPAAYRGVLAAVAAPAAFLPNVGQDLSAAPFSFWTKAGMVIRAGEAVTVRVAPALADRVHITWGSGTGAVVRFASCHTGTKWNAYAGGFLTRTATACVPLIFSVGGRHATVMFGLGRHCAK